MQKIFNRLRKEESGQSLVMVVLLLSVLLGFAALIVDVGLLYAEKAKLQNVADAAALAGAQMLPDQGSAESIAIDYAEFNDFTISTDDVDVPYDEDDTKIGVELESDVPYIFANFLDLIGTGTTISASAVAQKKISLPNVFTDYAIFSESNTIPLSVGKAGQSTINGTIHTNDTLELGKHLNVTRVEASSGITQKGENTIGSLDEAAPNVTIPTAFKSELLSMVSSAPIKYTGNKIFSGNGINLNQSVYVDGNVTIDGNNINGKGFIYATGDIVINGNKTKIGSSDEPVFIFSEKNITISGNSPDMYAVIYAPNGIIDVQKNNWNLHGRLIGNSFSDACLKNNFTITASDDDLSSIPLTSETIKLIE